MNAVEWCPWPENPAYLAGEDGSIIGPRGWVLSQCRGPRGYRIVNVRPRGQRRSEYAHVVVCEAWHGPRPKGMEVAHKNGIRHDNRPANLSWKTHAENMADKIVHGTYTRGEDHAPAKLTEQQVREILALAARGESQRLIGVRFGVTQACVSMIVRRKNWRHVS